MLKRFGVVFEYSMAWLLPIAGLSFVIAWLKFRKLSKLPDISKGMALLISGLRFMVKVRLVSEKPAPSPRSRSPGPRTLCAFLRLGLFKSKIMSNEYYGGVS